MESAESCRPPWVLFFEGLNHSYKDLEREHTVWFSSPQRFEFKPQDITLLVGRSGSGKSTLLNLIGGLDLPQGGQLRIRWDVHQQAKQRDMPRDHRGLAHYRREKVCYLFQDGGLIEEMSVMENVMLPLRYAAANARESREACRRALERVGLADKIGKHISQLSGGERHRVGLARTIARRAEIVICDEPTAALDKDTGQLVRKILEEEAERGACVFIATHDPVLIEANIANYIIELDEGCARVRKCRRNA
ncbi:ABC transporter ATP-binding protein [Hyphobacterium sp.]|uniref:ABC transporter ATP-binding protein n=1 Tax=Hyphobacterium sp. TaxID=2004662 RepID=UPI003747BF2C